MADNPVSLTSEPILSLFGQQRGAAVAAYRAFVAEGRNQPSPSLNCMRRVRLKNQIYLGTDAFVDKMQRKVNAKQDLREIPAAQRRKMSKPLEYYAKKISGSRCGDQTSLTGLSMAGNG